MSSHSLLFEIGVEELPASFLEGALAALPGLATDMLNEARLEHKDIKAYGTPRLLALLIDDVAQKQRDLDEEVQGPPSRIAFDDNGKLSKAGQKFAEKLGVSAEQLGTIDTEKGSYVVAKRKERGKDAKVVLSELLPRLASRIPFPKTMRWGQGDIAFGRPIHWLVALLDEQVLDFNFAKTSTGRKSRGHRFLYPKEIEVKEAAAYLETLRTAKVIADTEERRALIEQQLKEAAKTLGEELLYDPTLIGECADLVEQPQVVVGSFEEVFLGLPEEVIIAVMRGHQRYFALRNPKTKKLSQHFLTVANTAEDKESVSKGNGRVIRARLQDAFFFVNEDQKHNLKERSAQLDGVVFQSKLGSLGEKARRLRALSVELLKQNSKDLTNEREMSELCASAASLCKADLLSLMVGEFPELQGIMGRHYALKEGYDPKVAKAIQDHYLPKGAKDSVPDDVLSAAIAYADRLDTLVGCFGIGITPSGSADPFALRRAALGVIRMAFDGPMDLHLADALRTSYELYADGALKDSGICLNSVHNFFCSRLRSLFAEKYPGDLIEACLSAWDGGSLRDVKARMQALAEFRTMPEFESLAVAFKRAANITKDIKAGKVNVELLQDGAERELYEVLNKFLPRMQSALEKRNYAEALSMAASELRKPIDRFFEEVLSWSMMWPSRKTD
ncbi:MAG: glycine--tRNA ligase subunit beta [Myxococcales bacterium]|nr:MAG: glycine--tRNA ligase subunit beta [Myxococcales bacterium]